TVYNWNVFFEDTPVAERRGGQVPEGADTPIWFRDARRHIGSGNEFGEDVDVENSFHSFKTARNHYLIDRQLQKTQSFTGITGLNIQDRAIQESMGPIVDRSLERLGHTDLAIMQA